VRGRILAVDYGTRNVGLARSDELGVTVVPMPSLPNPGRRRLLETLEALAAEHDIAEIVVGMPWNMDGSTGRAAEEAAALMRDIRSRLGLPVRACDERLSTVEAAARWNTLSPRQQRRYRSIDSLAAALILERHLRGEG
jgi:putative Holliday junction resolvase